MAMPFSWIRDIKGVYHETLAFGRHDIEWVVLRDHCPKIPGSGGLRKVPGWLTPFNFILGELPAQQRLEMIQTMLDSKEKRDVLCSLVTLNPSISVRDFLVVYRQL